MHKKAFLILIGITAVIVLSISVFETHDTVEAPSEATIDVTEESGAVVEEGAVTGVVEGTPASSEETDNTATASGASASPVAKPAASPVTPLPQSNSIVLLDAESGTMVTVATARLTRPGFIAIYRTNSNEETTLIGYSSLLRPGSYTDLRIQVSNPVAWKQVVTAVIHEDDGDGKFEFPVSDSYLKNGNALVYDEDVVGVPIVEEFGLINGTVEDHLEDARKTLSGS